MHQKQLLNLTIKKLIGEATADELLALDNLVKNHPEDAFFVNTMTAFFNTEAEIEEGQSERLFNRIKGKIKP
ncbi:hypothetical protein [Mucilaginibacter ginsenosidivorax]|uniref:Uncharacterized protein n=1 Tax=Mucilaginibacter ginsenosidivorax TaxID=862126 RepID=A0A5B8W2S8_9SPHI|nr:hypothetical protein [Mucilaginibacter ginsenosidivorax]QEC77757.1 hypothetical protein FSB76_18080 [Mucilaginibacter ginsenosidivorax]